MIYRNEDYRALRALEEERTGNYGELENFNENTELCCPLCGTEGPKFFYINDDDECVGCTSCIYKSAEPY